MTDADAPHDPEALAAMYAASLTRFVETGEESQLEEAYSLGRAAFSDDVSILDLVDVHRQATEALVKGAKVGAKPARLAASFGFLAEALATFEMAQRGYWEAQERARLERDQASRRDRLNQGYMTVDRTVELADRLAAIEQVAAGLVDAAGARCYLVEEVTGPAEIGPNHLVFAVRDPRGAKVAVLDVDLTGRPTLNEADHFLLEEFARMAGVAVENARQFARERAIAIMLQLNLLPAATPRVDGLDVAVRYLPGEANSHAGGDWYDVFSVDDDHVGLVVGDVTGHGVAAAAAMGQLRIAVLAYAVTGAAPAAVVEQVDALLERLGTGEVATMVYVVANPTDGTLQLVNAGHPPPVLIDPVQAVARPWRGGHGRLLGMPEGGPFKRHHGLDELPAGGHLLLYTDGLIEPLERGEQDGVARLCEVTAGFQGSATELCDYVLAEMAPDGGRDDICIVAVTAVG